VKKLLLVCACVVIIVQACLLPDQLGVGVSGGGQQYSAPDGSSRFDGTTETLSIWGIWNVGESWQEKTYKALERQNTILLAGGTQPVATPAQPIIIDHRDDSPDVHPIVIENSDGTLDDLPPPPKTIEEGLLFIMWALGLLILSFAGVKVVKYFKN